VGAAPPRAHYTEASEQPQVARSLAWKRFPTYHKNICEGITKKEKKLALI
jgi:hypothetical protein